MNVEYTGRQCEVTPSLRKEVETGLAKIRKILGDKFDSKVVLAIEKHRHKAEITVSARNRPLVGAPKATDMSSAIGEAFEHLQKQAVKYKTRWRSKNAMPRKIREKVERRSHAGRSENRSGTYLNHGPRGARAPLSARRQDHRCSSRSLRRFSRAASHDVGRGYQRGAFPRPGRVRFPRSQRQSNGSSPHP